MVCIDEEIPFEIPATWEWCRISHLFLHASGKQQSSSNKGYGTPQKFITTSNLYWGRFVLDNVKVMNFTEEEIKIVLPPKEIYLYVKEELDMDALQYGIKNMTFVFKIMSTDYAL